MPAKSWMDLMNEAEEGSKEFAPLEEGMYSFVIKDPAKVGETGKGNPKFTINPSVESGPRANARVFHDFSVSDSAYAMKNFFFGDLAQLGLDSSFFASNPSDQQIAQALQGRRFTAQVSYEEGSNGKKYARLSNFSGPTSAPPSAGVPSGLPAAAPAVSNAAPVAQAAPAPAPQAAAPSVDPSSPWATVPTPSAPAPGNFSNSVPLPPSFS